MNASTLRRLTRSIAPLAAAGAAAFVIGCGDDEEKDTSAAPAQPASFQIEATAKGRNKALTFPSSVKAGVVELTLKNSDKAPRSAQIVRVEGDRTVDDVLKIVNAEETKIPDWIQDGGGLAAVKPGQTATATQVLAPGKYAIWDDEGGMDDGPSNSELGAKGEFTVTGPATDAQLPERPAKVTATDDGKDEYGFEFSGLKAGTNDVRFENTGEELHHALFFPLREGVTLEQATKAFESEEPPQGPPPVDFAKGVGTSVIDGDIAQNIKLDLPAGRYAVVCFISDREGGKPHVAQGMIEELEVK